MKERRRDAAASDFTGFGLVWVSLQPPTPRRRNGTEPLAAQRQRFLTSWRFLIEQPSQSSTLSLHRRVKIQENIQPGMMNMELCFFGGGVTFPFYCCSPDLKCRRQIVTSHWSRDWNSQNVIIHDWIFLEQLSLWPRHWSLEHSEQEEQHLKFFCQKTPPSFLL